MFSDRFMLTQKNHDISVDLVPDIELLVREDKLRLLFRQSFPALFISYAIALLLSWMLRGHTNDTALLAWLSVLAVSTVGRLAIFVTYFRTTPRGAELVEMERRYVVLLLISSLVWGIGALIIMPAASPFHQAVTLSVLVGMAGGAVSMYSACYPMAVGAMTAVLLPSTIWLFAQGGREQTGLAIGASIFMLVLLRAAKVLANALQDNFRLGRELHAAHAAADLQARTDSLTGINNRRAFLDHASRIIRNCERHKSMLAALIMDVDNFKTINDSRGHFAGDTVLRHVGQTIRQSFRCSDVFGRIGGEEFAVVLPHTSESDVQSIAEKLCRTIAETPIAYGDQRLAITVSIGIAAGSYDLSVLMVHADKAMYRAKEQGRNRVVSYEETDPRA
jgi:diguanylate cyclase (GGDEF)-like protein